MTALEKIGNIGLVPVVVVESAEEGVKTARALLDGGIPIMEITMRTEAGIAAIKAVKESLPEMLVGAGTVLTLQKCKEAVASGAEFIVSPGYSDGIVGWCKENNTAVTPGCITPTEITKAIENGITTLKFFPAGVYGGAAAMAALYAPFKQTGIKFIPTGGIDLKNLEEYAGKPFIHAIGGGWLANTKNIKAGNFDAIRETAKESLRKLREYNN